MASRLIEVNTSTLRSDVSAVQEEISKLKACDERMRAALSSLQRMWEGNSAVAFHAAVTDDLRRMSELVKAIQSLTDRTGTAREEYDKCESAVSQIVSSLRV